MEKWSAKKRDLYREKEHGKGKNKKNSTEHSRNTFITNTDERSSPLNYFIH